MNTVTASIPAEDESHKTFLVVEDEQPIGNLIRQFLTSNGYNIHVTSTGKESVTDFNSERPDGIILDVALPDVFGNELFEYFQRMNIPVLVTSTMPREEVADIMGTKKFHFLPKPFDLESLLSELKSI